MTLKKIQERIAAITKLQKAFDTRVKKAESELLIDILGSWDMLRDKLLPTFKKVWNGFTEKQYIPLIESYVDDVNKIVKLNELYFDNKVPTEVLFERMGINQAGLIQKDGYVSTIIQDQTAKREVQKFLSRTKELKFDQKVKEDVKKMITGQEDKPGVIQKFTDANVTDTYTEADAILQNDYATVNFMNAGMYTGGLIDTSRDFCEIRNRKVFLRTEIEKFGTSEDKWGGYTDKANGMFNGKPKEGYDPFTQRGGYRCRHHWSWLADEYAIRQDKTLIIVDGKLKRLE